MRLAIALGVLSAAAVAHADASAPAPAAPSVHVQLAGKTIDLRAGTAEDGAAGSARCPDEASFPSRIAWREAERRKLPRPNETNIVDLTARHALMATFWRGRTPAGAVVDLASGKELSRFGDEPAALIEDGRGEVLGLVAIDEKAGEVKRLDPDGKVRWRTKVANLRGDRARAILDGTRLFVAPFEGISTGAELRAFDWASGAALWRGDVREIRAAHSEYEHDVRLSVRYGRVMLEGVESAGCTLQLFDRATGARRLEVTSPSPGWGE